VRGAFSAFAVLDESLDGGLLVGDALALNEVPLLLRLAERKYDLCAGNCANFLVPKGLTYPVQALFSAADPLMPEKRRILSVVAAMLLFGLFGPAAASADRIPPLPVQLSNGPALAPSSHEIAIIRAVNRVRAAHGRRPLRYGPALHRAARAHSVDMVRRGYFDHGAFVLRLRRFGVRGQALGENLAYATEPGFSAAMIVQMWMTSPGHRSVMLDGSFSRIGVGVAGGVTRRVTADFAG
jgi:Cysteine-rich secretory protein family